jgi:hypothetical protein
MGLAVENDTGLEFILGDIIPVRFTITVISNPRHRTVSAKRSIYVTRSG